MAKKKAGKTKAAAKAPGKVVCFFFYGSIDELGDALATFVDNSEVASSAFASITNAVTPK